MNKRKTRLEILLEDIEECYTILETYYIEIDILMLIDDSNSVSNSKTESLSQYGNEIKSMLKRIAALKKLLYKEQNPEEVLHFEDFVCSIIIDRKNM